MNNVFGKTKKLEFQIDEYLDVVMRGSLVFKQGIKYYLNKQLQEFEVKLKELEMLENNADNLRRSIETKLYTYTLIPDHRGDVLGLIENSDKVINKLKDTLTQFSVELPEIYPDIQLLFTELTEVCTFAVESTVQAVRSYFREFQLVRDHINKVLFYEKEADKLSDRIKRDIFRRTDIHLSEKMHLRNFTFHIDSIADRAEDVCDRLSIAVIKREV